MQALEGGEVITVSIPGLGHLRLSDVESDGDAGPLIRSPQSLEAGRHGFASLVVESEAVDERLQVGVSEETRLGVAGLGQGGDGADLDEAEAECLPRGERDTVLVHPGGEAHGITKRDPGNRAGSFRNSRSDRHPNKAGILRSSLKQTHHGVVRDLRVE